MYLRFIYGPHKKWGSLYTFRRHGYSPLEPDLAWIDARVGPRSVIIRSPWGRVRVPPWSGYFPVPGYRTRYRDNIRHDSVF